MSSPAPQNSLFDSLKTFVEQAHLGQQDNLVGSISHRDFIVLAFLIILNRFPDDAGTEYYLKRLDGGLINRQQFIHFLFESDEYRQRFAPKFSDRLHEARLEFIKTLPKADCIVDLGGACPTVPEGALYVSGYPHRARRLIIVDLPHDDRMVNPLDFREERLVRDYGVIDYVHSSMANLSAIEDDVADLVFAGESIEHVNRDEGALVIAEALRVLRPGGYFCLDTPNSKLTRIHCPTEFIHREHKIEYAPNELIDMLQKGGFEIVETGGICPMPETLSTGVFDETEVFRMPALSVEADISYCFYVKCRKPIGSGGDSTSDQRN